MQCWTQAKQAEEERRQAEERLRREQARKQREEDAARYGDCVLDAYAMWTVIVRIVQAWR